MKNTAHYKSRVCLDRNLIMLNDTHREKLKFNTRIY